MSFSFSYFSTALAAFFIRSLRGSRVPTRFYNHVTSWARLIPFSRPRLLPRCTALSRHLATEFVLVRLYVIYRRRSGDSRTRLSSACSACCSSSLTLRHLHRFGRESEATTGCSSVNTVLSVSAQGCRGWQSRQRRMPPAARRGLHLPCGLLDTRGQVTRYGGTVHFVQYAAFGH